MHSVRIVLAGVALASALVCAAEGEHNRYKWRDAQGNLHFDDALPDQALQYGYDIVNERGMVIRHVERAKTAEELAAEQAAAAEDAAQKRAAEDRAKADQQMLAAYPTEQEFTHAQQAQLDMIDQAIHATELSLQSQEKSLTDMLSHAADLDRSGKPVPNTLKQQIEELRHNIERQKAYIAAKQAEKAERAKAYEANLAHYREVQAKLHAGH